MGLRAGVAPRRGRFVGTGPGLESPGYQQGIAPRWVLAALMVSSEMRGFDAERRLP